MPARFRLSLLAVMVFSATPVFGAERLGKPEFLAHAENFSAVEATRGIHDIADRLAFRAQDQPFLPIATAIFLLAILHTFLAVPITRLAHRIEHEHDAQIARDPQHHETPDAYRRVSFKATLLHFLGEVEAIFGIWAVVLLAVMTGFYGLDAMKGYLAGVNFSEPMFVVVIMALASTRPVLRFAESCLRFFARFGKESPAAWWLSILIVAPILGSFITEPGAMTIAAILLARKFYRLKPNSRFAYGTLGLLFVNISIGGVLTNFAAPPVLMVAETWKLTTPYMLVHFGCKAVLAIMLATLVYYLFFRRELKALAVQVPDVDGDGIADWSQRETPVPWYITATHLLFMVITVSFLHDPPIFIGGFLFFLAFSKATRHHQNPVSLRGPILVGFFLAGLVVHGGLQGWWLQPILASLGEWPLFAGSTLLTSFNDNAAITYLASQVEGLSPSMKYAVLAGAVTGGGLTVIANAPNPAGQTLLARFFGEGVSPMKLLLSALIPTLLAAACFMLLPR
jgi:Na+/H+ antiporter NhaD/arsenite permease-like protein